MIMKRIPLNTFGCMTVMVMALLMMHSCSNGIVKINEKNFPDPAFRSYLLEEDYGQDGVLTKEEIQSIDILYVEEKDIESLKGIEIFTALKNLRCWNNKLTELDLSPCKELKSLSCEKNQLTELNLSGCSELDHLSCYKNQLTRLDLSPCKALNHLQCEDNQLTELNVSGCSDLTTLICHNNQLTKLELASTLPDLWIFQCNKNQLTELDVSTCPKLQQLDCQENQLTKLNLTGCEELKHINCADNQLTELDPTPCQALYYLNCSGNKLTKLDLSPCTELNYLVCANNQLSSEAMDALIESLRKGDLTQIHPSSLCLFSEDNEGNACTGKQLTRAGAKGWKLLFKSGEEEKEYKGSKQ